MQYTVRTAPGMADRAVMQQPAPARQGFRLRDRGLLCLTGLGPRASVGTVARAVPRIMPRIMR